MFQQFFNICTSCVCVRLYCLFSAQFVCVMNLLNIFMFLSTLLINAVVFVHMNLTVRHFKHVALGV